MAAQFTEDSIVGKKAQELFDDAGGLLKGILEKRLLTAKAVHGSFPANSVGDDIEVHRDESRSEVLATFHTLRQQHEKLAGESNYALADFLAPKANGVADYLGRFAVTTGIGLDAVCRRFENNHDDYNSIMAKALAGRSVCRMATSGSPQRVRLWKRGNAVQ